MSAAWVRRIGEQPIEFRFEPDVTQTLADALSSSVGSEVPLDPGADAAQIRARFELYAAALADAVFPAPAQAPRQPAEFDLPTSPADLAERARRLAVLAQLIGPDDRSEARARFLSAVGELQKRAQAPVPRLAALAAFPVRGLYVYAAALSPDGRSALVGGAPLETTSGGAATLWDAASLKPLSTFSEGSAVYSAGFHPDGRRALTGSLMGAVKVWDAAAGSAILNLESSNNTARSVQFSRDGKSVLAALSSTARVWDAITGALRHILRAEDILSSRAAFSPDGSRIFWAGENKDPTLWDAVSGARTMRFSGKRGSNYYSAAFSPDGRRVLAGSYEGAVVWSVDRGRPALKLIHDQSVTAAAFSRAGGRIVTSDGSAVRIWDAATGRELRQWSPDGARVVSIETREDGAYVFTQVKDDAVRLWRIPLD